MRNNNRETESIIPWICIIVIIIIVCMRSHKNNICIIGQTESNERFKQLFGHSDDSDRSNLGPLNRLSSHLQRDDLIGCNEIYILEAPERSEISKNPEIYRMKSTEFFVILTQIYNVNYLLKGIIPNDITKEQAYQLLKLS